MFSYLRITTVSLFLFLTFIAVSQVSEDFSDGDFSHYPPWTGDISDFKISLSNAVPSSMHPALQLDGSDQDTSYLVVQQTPFEAAEWSFWIKLSFNTSAGNYARLYLASDQANLKGPLNGYFLQIGGQNDSLILFRQTGAYLEPILKGQTAFSGNSTNVFRAKVVYDDEMLWQLFIDPEGGTNFLLDGTQQDILYEPEGYFGLFCKYSASNATKIYFDDMVSSKFLPDTIPPEIIDITFISEHSISLKFSELLVSSTSLDISNYIVTPTLGSPIQVINNSAENLVLELLFEDTFQEGVNYTLQTFEITDLAGNPLVNPSVDFFYVMPYVIQPYDILINEIMADIDPPPMGLPMASYVELFNGSTQNIPLGSLSIKLKESMDPLLFPDHELSFGEYLIITDPDHVYQFQEYGNVIGLEGFFLYREGMIQLLNTNGQLIHFLEYEKETYKHVFKQEGGWALEMIDPLNPCLLINNWKVSISVDGGTPGSINSVDADNNDPSSILEAVCEGDSMVRIKMNYALDFPGAILAENIFIDLGMGSPSKVYPLDSLYSRFMLEFDQPFLPERIYNLRMSGISDRRGDPLSDPETFPFGVPQFPEYHDAVINEVLFDPTGSGVDYVEIYNRGLKVLNIKQLRIGNLTWDQFGIPDTSLKLITDEDRLLLMGEYVVLTNEPWTVKDQYQSHAPQKFIKVNALPTYPNEEGTVLLATITGDVIDQVSYDQTMHHPLVKDREGVSLERIHFDRFSGDRGNWHSASSSSGYGTPGLRNSQFQDIQQDSEGVVFIYPEIFSPDNDGIDDVVSIHFRFQRPGYLATVSVYDHEGRPVRMLMNNELMGTDPVVSWDGKNDINQESHLGIYILLMEAFHPDGHIIREKKAIILAGRLN